MPGAGSAQATGSRPCRYRPQISHSRSFGRPHAGPSASRHSDRPGQRSVNWTTGLCLLRTRWHKPLQCDFGQSGISAYSTEQHAGNQVHAPDWGVAADSEQSTISGFGILQVPLDTCQCCNALVAPTPSASPPLFMIWHESASPPPIHDLNAISREQLCFPRRRVMLADWLLPSQVWSDPKQISTSAKWCQIFPFAKSSQCQIFLMMPNLPFDSNYWIS